MIVPISVEGCYLAADTAIPQLEVRSQQLLTVLCNNKSHYCHYLKPSNRIDCKTPGFRPDLASFQFPPHPFLIHYL